MREGRREASSPRAVRSWGVTVWAVRPWERALREERDLPSGVRGPVDWVALARLALRRACEVFLFIHECGTEGLGKERQGMGKWLRGCGKWGRERW
jgi:hypothetical protein